MRFAGTHKRGQRLSAPPPMTAEAVVRRKAPRCPLSGKVSYATPAKARKVLKTSKGLHSMYRCGCGAWHLTHLRSVERYERFNRVARRARKAAQP